MKSNRIFVLHEFGAPSHYYGLVELGNQRDFDVKFRIFNPQKIIKGIFSKQYAISLKSLTFLLSLPFTRNKQIILGIAPYNRLMYPLSLILKRHIVYYHTSYTSWDGSITARPTKSVRLKNLWLDFLRNKVSHIFAVSQKTKDELIRNRITEPDKITVVNHSYNIPINYISHDKDNTFIYVGRLVKSKGIPELLDIFSKIPNASLTIVGNGELESLVVEYSDRYENINYLGYVSGLENLIPIYQRHSFLIMNSKHTERWEELFGLAIIEGMACGCVPLASNHSGPKEIITNGTNGFLYPEGQLRNEVSHVLSMTDKEYQNIRKATIQRGQSFHSSQISSKWNRLIDA